MLLPQVPGTSRSLFFFSSRRRHTRWPRDWSSDVCSSDLPVSAGSAPPAGARAFLRIFTHPVLIAGTRNAADSPRTIHMGGALGGLVCVTARPVVTWPDLSDPGGSARRKDTDVVFDDAVNKAKNFAKGNQDKVDQGLDAASEQVKNRVGDEHHDKIDGAADAARDHLGVGGDQGKGGNQGSQGNQGASQGNRGTSQGNQGGFQGNQNQGGNQGQGGGQRNQGQGGNPSQGGNPGQGGNQGNPNQGGR